MVHDQMKEVWSLEALHEPAWMNHKGDIVMYAEEVLEMKATHRMNHPEYMIFVDEAVNNTNMKDYEKVGGKRLLKEKGQKAKITAAISNAHLTVLGFTGATGEPVMCTIMFPGNELTP